MVISPNEMNKHLSTVIIAPLTTTLRNYPTRVNCKFDNKSGQLVLDQIRTVDKSRLIKQLGSFNDKGLIIKILSILQKMFAYQS